MFREFQLVSEECTKVTDKNCKQMVRVLAQVQKSRKKKKSVYYNIVHSKTGCSHP